ncbi:MAG: hypothetical protein HQK87_08580 [Nitrospinae bacterium]|nr:hypothetical protein [Nitrospinota bacterium]
MKRRGLKQTATAVVAALAMTFGAAPTATAKKAEGHDYVISINYELGMHCTGFDFSYCCVLPPYNSILTQIVKNGKFSKDGKPALLGADPKDPTIVVDGDKRFKLFYEHIDNSYSEGNKMAYWNVPYDMNGDGNPYGPNESVANAYFDHLYVYADLEGSNPDNTSADSKKLRVGADMPIPLDAGPAGQPVSGGYLRYSGDKGTIVYTKSPVLDNTPIMLTNPGVWEALGLPLTPFLDSEMTKGILKVQETDIQPFQQGRVTLVDAASGKAVIDSTTGKPVSYVGTNPIDVPNCFNCHSNENANGAKYNKYKGEMAYWKSVGASEWFSELKATAISIMEIHDDKHGTDFLSKYNPKATSNRLGRGAVLCQKCHADNVIGVLASKTKGDVVKGAKDGAKVIPALTQAIHSAHQKLRPMPDGQGRTGSCQGCHPAHRQNRSMEGYPITKDGKNAYATADNRDAKGGCFVGRDVHSNPGASKALGTGAQLNAVGQYLADNVVKEGGKYKGLWCTNCHNQLTRELYQRDNLENAFLQTGETLRNKTLDQIAEALKVDKATLISRYIDPKVPMEGEDKDSGVMLTWAEERTVPDIAVIAIKNGGPVISKDGDGDVSVSILSANPMTKVEGGMAVPYSAATHGRDYWLSAGEPHCADCHAAPYGEGQGGAAFPINQPGKPSLMRYSKGHAGLTCQTCHESIHGLYPVTDKVDLTSYNQAASMNPDGSHGPVKCAACHQVNKGGVPTVAEKRLYKGKKLGEDYGLAVTYMHSIGIDKGGANPN